MRRYHVSAHNHLSENSGLAAIVHHASMYSDFFVSAMAPGLGRESPSLVEHDAKFVSTGDGVFQSNSPPVPNITALFDRATPDEVMNIRMYGRRALVCEIRGLPYGPVPIVVV
mmetsp:Transcript_3372/g.6710  ORF Transcript_3372/g.6710 Transcript_3372/m.6710 type:complete len:113 (-) Transcript_3372:13-351(-)